MKSYREQMIDALIDQVEDWDLDGLIDFVQGVLRIECNNQPTHEIEEVYNMLCGVEDYPETFDGYNEP